MKIEAEKHYRSRNGAIYGPMVWNPHYELWEANGLAWVIGGQFYSGDAEHDNDLIEEATPTVPHSTFPTWEEFKEWFDDTEITNTRVYNFFLARIKPLEVGQEYEVSHNRKDWIKTTLRGYNASLDCFTHIRPIQPTLEPDLLDSLRAWQNGDLAFDKMPEVLERAIKALEGEE